MNASRPDPLRDARPAGRPVRESPVGETKTPHPGHNTTPLYRPSERRGQGARRRRDPAWDRPVRRRRRPDGGSRADRPRTPRGQWRGPRRPRRRTPGAELRRLRRLIAIGLVLIVSAVTLGSTLRSGDAPTDDADTPGPRPATALLPSGPPKPQRLALHDGVQLWVPIEQSRITATLYHRVVGGRALDLEPQGRLLNAGLVKGLGRKVWDPSDAQGPEYLVSGSTDSVDVGAVAGTQVYSPVDGQVVAIQPNIVNGKLNGSYISIQPHDNPGLVIVVSHVLERPAGELYVGKEVYAGPGGDGPTLIGTVEDLSDVMEQELARFTQDVGNHVHLEVQRSTAIPIP